MNLAVRRKQETHFIAPEVRNAAETSSAPPGDRYRGATPELTTQLRSVIGAPAVLKQAPTLEAGLSGAQLLTANEVLKADPAMRQLLGLEKGTVLSGSELNQRLAELPPERRELATSMLAYHIGANQQVDQSAVEPLQTFSKAMGAPSLNKMPHSVKKVLEDARGNKPGKLTAGEAVHLLGTKPATFDAVVSKLASSGDPALRGTARSMIDQNLSLPQDRRAKLLSALGLDPAARSEAIEAHYQERQTEVLQQAGLIYQQLGGPTQFASSQFVATGDGTSTTGLLGKTNKGVGLFKYEVDPKSGKTEHSQSTTLTPTSESTSLLLDLKGIDHSGGRVSVSIDGHTLELAADRNHPVLQVRNAGDFAGSPHPSDPAVMVYRAGEIEVQHNTESNIFSVRDPGQHPIALTLNSQQSKGDWDEVTLGVYATDNPNQGPPLELQVPLTDAYQLGSWKLNEEKVSRQFATGLSPEQKALLREHFEAGGALILTPRGHGIGHLEDGQVVDGVSPEQHGPNAGARYTGVEAELHRGDSGNYLEVDIDSFTDDVPAQGIRARLSAEGQQFFDDFLAAHPKNDPNDVLSALRSFSMMEHFTGILSREGGLGPEQANRTLAQSKVTLDDGSQISYADYQRMTGP